MAVTYEKDDKSPRGRSFLPVTSNYILRKSTRRPFFSILSFVTALSLLTSVVYLVQRVRLTRASETSSTVWIVIVVEILTSVPALFTQIGILISALQAQGDRLPQSLESEERPRIDIFIAYCGEGEEIILNTTKATCVLNWPSDRFRVIVLDDSHSGELAKKVKRLSEEVSPELLYASRGSEVHTHSKAANLNFGLRYVESLAYGKADFMAVLDVDMIPEPDWICQVLPYVLNDSRAGLACPPQRYYNLPRGDPLGVLTEDLPGECVVRLQDFSNSALCTGSGFVARRSALDAIGGIPEESMQEDDLTSHKLLAAGWHTVFVPVSVQWGLGPETFAGYIKQMTRWAVGLISVSFLTGAEWAERLSFFDRLILNMWGIYVGATAFIWTFVLVVLPILVMLGQRLVSVTDMDGLRSLMRWALLNFITQSLYHYCMSSFVDFRLPVYTLFGAVWTQPWKLMMIIRYFLVTPLFTWSLPGFTPTGMPVDGEEERKARTRRSRTAMFKVVFWDCSAYFYLVVLCLFVAGIAKWTQIILYSSSVEGVYRAGINALTGIAWPPVFLLWAALLRTSWVPLAYALRPVPMPSRANLLVRDPSTGVEYPTQQAKDDLMRRPKQGLFLAKSLFYFFAWLFCELMKDMNVS